MNFVECTHDDEGLHFGIDLTGKVPGLDFARRELAGRHQRQRGIFYWLHIAPVDGPEQDFARTIVTVEANWRFGGSIAQFEHLFSPSQRFDEAAATETDALREVVQRAVVHMLEDLDKKAGMTLSRASSYEAPHH